MCISEHLFCFVLFIRTLCMRQLIFMHMFVPLFIFIDIVFVLMGRMDMLSCTNTSGKCSMNISGQHYD